MPPATEPRARLDGRNERRTSLALPIALEAGGAADLGAKELLRLIAEIPFDRIGHALIAGVPEDVASIAEAALAPCTEPPIRTSLGPHGQLRFCHLSEGTLALLPPYAGRALLAAAAAQAADLKAGAPLSEDEVDAAHRALAGPDPEVILVPGRAAHLSEGFVWGAAYAEFVFIDTPWRGLGRADFTAALGRFAGRDRRFGGLETGAVR